MTQIWKGKTEYFHEMVDALMCAGIKTEVDSKKWTISVDSKNYGQANGILMELNQLLEAGW